MTILNGQPIGDPNQRLPKATPAPPPSIAPDNSHYGLGLIALISSFVVPPAGLVVGAIAMRGAKRAGATNPLAVAGFWIGLTLTVIIAIFIAIGIVAAILGFGFFSNLVATCQQLGPGVHTYDGVTWTCN